MGASTRSYSDPSYGSKKVLRFSKWSCGTRATETVESIPMMHKFRVTDAVMKSVVAGSGAVSSWTLKAGTTVLATMSFATNATAATVINGTITDYEAGKDTLLNLGSILGTADPAQNMEMYVEYEEVFDVSND